MGTGADFFAAAIGGITGGALVWHFRDNVFIPLGRKFVSWFKGAQYLAAKAQADVNTLTAKLNAAKAAASTVTAAK